METTAVTVKCSRCRRTLRSAKSRAAGIGFICALRKRQEAAAAAWKPEQVAKALQLIADGGLIRSAIKGVWLAVSSAGDDVYRVHANGCDCPAGEHSRACYHGCAFAIRTA